MSKPTKYQLDQLRNEVIALDRMLDKHEERAYSNSADRQAAIRREWTSRRDAAQAAIARYEDKVRT